ncbi:MAG: SH3 domain-containing protein [Candidatus Riflebacteria bacterium]|nr:SH3 domain-containing protein [Candidatus Riflebacteria bacterium]
MKKIILLVMFFCVICFTTESALPNLNKAASSANTSVSADNNSTIVDTKSALNLNSSSTTASSSTTGTASPTAEVSLATLPNGKAYVGVSTFLALRDEPFGTVLARLYNNEEVLIVNRNGDWYEIESAKGSGWIYGKCVFASPNSNPSGAASDTANISETTDNGVDVGSKTYNYTVFNNPGQYTTTSSTSSSSTQKTKTTTKTTTTKKTTTAKKSSGGTLQQKIVNAAKDVVKKYSKKGSFPYAPGLKGGVLGCAHVATTVLKKAGAIKSISYGCKQTIGLLQKAGWKKTKVPPYKAGDVIFWTQTDKKKSKGPTHVGIIMESGNNVQAMSNSSSQKRPRYHKANYAKVYCVMRKA